MFLNRTGPPSTERKFTVCDISSILVSLLAVKHSSREVSLNWRKEKAVTMNPELTLLQFSHRIIKTYRANTTSIDFGGTP